VGLAVDVGVDGQRVHAGAAGAGGPFGGDPFDGGLGDIFEEFFGGRRRSREGPRKGPDLRTELVIDLEDAYRGVEKQMTVSRPERCPTCEGTGHPPGADPQTCPECGGRGQVTQVSQTPFGRMQQTSTCRRCNGEGRLYTETCTECRGEGQVRREATLEVEVPAGIEDGQTLRMEGEGAPGERGGPNGDLLIDIAIEDHPRFERDGADLHLVEPLSFPQAVFGARVTVPTFDGDENAWEVRVSKALYLLNQVPEVPAIPDNLGGLMFGHVDESIDDVIERTQLALDRLVDKRKVLTETNDQGDEVYTLVSEEQESILRRAETKAEQVSPHQLSAWLKTRLIDTDDFLRSDGSLYETDVGSERLVPLRYEYSILDPVDRAPTTDYDAIRIRILAENSTISDDQLRFSLSSSFLRD
jgi:curved DNA-binding protein CbpA